MTAGDASRDCGFRRDLRLHKPAEFAAVFNSRRVIKGHWFYLHYGTTADHARLGLVIPKKHARRAVARNLLKRIGREAFRQARLGLPARDLIVRLVLPVQAEMGREAQIRRGWRAEIDGLLLKVPK